jgi:DNA repair protein RadC
MLTPQEVMQAFAQNDLAVMMDAIRQVADRQEQNQIIRHPADYAFRVMPDLGVRNREEFWVTSMDNAGTVIATHAPYVGTVYTAVLRIAEIMRLVLIDDATTFIVAHNHPGGDVTPSPHDIQTTRNLYKVGLLMGIPLMDHIIVAPGKWYSFLEHNLLVEETNVRTNENQGSSRLPGPSNGSPQRTAVRKG